MNKIEFYDQSGNIIFNQIIIYVKKEYFFEDSSEKVSYLIWTLCNKNINNSLLESLLTLPKCILKTKNKEDEIIISDCDVKKIKIHGFDFQNYKSFALFFKKEINN